MAGMTIQVPDDDEDLIVTDTNEAPRRRPSLGKDDLNSNTAGFNDLKAQLDQAAKGKDDEKRRADAAEERARRAAQEAETARREVDDVRTENVETRRTAVENALVAAKTSMDSLESELASAFEAGDAKKVATYQRRMSELGGQIAQLESGKSALAAEPEPDKRRVKEGRVERDEVRRPEPKTDEEKFERHIEQYSPAVREWLRVHPEVVTNQTKRDTAMSAHHAALAAGYRAESDEYFSYLDRKMGYRSSRAAEDIRRDNPIEDEQTRDRPMRSAPARGSNGGGGNNSRSVELTANEVAYATDGTVVWNAGQTDRRGKRIEASDPRVGEPIGVEEFARRKRDLAREGRFAVPTL
jgi:hypothetical protein